MCTCAPSALHEVIKWLETIAPSNKVGVRDRGIFDSRNCRDIYSLGNFLIDDDKCAASFEGIPTAEERGSADNTNDNFLNTIAISLHQADQSCPGGNSAQEILCSINRIDNPVTVLLSSFCTKLFTNDSIIGAMCMKK